MNWWPRLRRPALRIGADASAFRAAKVLANRGDYEGAADAALAGWTYSGRDEALTLVVHDAIADGEYVHSLTTAGKLYYPSRHDHVELEVFGAIRDAVGVLMLDGGQTIEWPIERFPSFEQMRDAAESDGSYSLAKPSRMRTISEIAVMLRNYDIAIFILHQSFTIPRRRQRL